MNLTERINGSALDQEVIDALDHLQQGTLVANPLQPIAKFSSNVLDSPHIHYLGHPTTFARMWTAIERVGGRFHPDYNDEIKENSKGVFYYHPNGDKTQSVVIPRADIGKYPYMTSDTKTFVINDNSSPSYVENIESVYESVSFDSVGNDYLKPKTGITQISRRTDGPVGAIAFTTVDFTVHNHREFEQIIQPYFFQVGSTVVVDFGWSHMGSSFDEAAFYDPRTFTEGAISMDRIEEMIYGRGHKFTSDYIPGLLRDKNHRGRVSVDIGNVISFTAKLDENNSYQCTIEICSRNTALASKEINKENGLEYLFGNAMDNIVRNIYAEVHGIDTSAGVDAGLSKEQLKVAQENSIDGLTTQIDMSNAVVTGDLGITDGTEDNRTAEEQLREAGINTENNRSTTGIISPLGSNNTRGGFIGPTLTAEQYAELTEKNMEKVLNAIELKTGGDIPQKHKKFGVHKDGDKLYIAYGMLEDIYLNVYLTPTLDEKVDYNLTFNSRKSYLRFDQEFLKMQTCQLRGDEKRNVFKIPADWTDSYNSKVMQKNTTQVSHEKNAMYSLEYYDENGEYVEPEQLSDDGGADFKEPLYGVPIIPIRDVFLDVSFITKVFKNSTSVSDALQSIWNRVSVESGDVWNILISSVNDASNTSISFQDVHLTRGQLKKIDVYEFDVTSPNSIVSGNDLTFQIPKDKISAAVAMRSLLEPTTVKSKDLRELMDFIKLSPSVDGDAKQFWRTIPNTGKTNLRSDKDVGGDNKNAVGVGIQIAKTLRNTVGDDAIEQNKYDDPAYATRSFINNINFYQAQNKNKDSEKNKNEAIDKVEGSDSDDEKTKKQANTPKEAILETLKSKVFDSTDSGFSIHRFLPMELSLTVYGNTFLDILDFITVNNVPQYMKDHFAFQIMGIEQQCSSDGWKTTYTAVMRNLRSSVNVKTRLKEPDKIVEPEVKLPPEETVQELQDDPADAALPAEETAHIEEVVEEVKKIEPFKPLLTILGPNLPAKFGYDVLETTFYLSEKQIRGKQNKKSNVVRATEISTLQDLAYGYAIRDHFLDPTFTAQSSIVQLYNPDEPAPVQLQPLDRDNTRLVIGQFIDDYAVNAVGDFIERVSTMNHPPDFVHSYTALETLNLGEDDLSKFALDNLEIPTIPYQITLAMHNPEEKLYKVTQERGAPTIFNEFFLPQTALAVGVSYETFLRGLMSKYFEYYVMLSTKKTSEELKAGKEAETDVSEEKTPEEVDEAPIDNNSESLWVESYMFLDMIRVNMSAEGAVDVDIYHYFIFLALDKIRQMARDEFFDKILPYTEEIVNVKSDAERKKSDVSFARGTSFYLKEREWYAGYKAWSLDPSLHTSENGYNIILYDLIEVILHECYHCYQAANKTRVFGANWAEPTTDWETPTIEFEGLTMEKIMNNDKANLTSSDQRYIEGEVLSSLATVRENKYQASLDPPGKLNHADVDADGDVDKDDRAIMALQNAAGRNSQSMTGLSDEEISEIYGEEVTKKSKKFLRNPFKDYFRKIKFHFDTAIEIRKRRDRKFLADTKKGMSDEEYAAWYLRRSAQGGFRTGPGLD